MRIYYSYSWISRLSTSNISTGIAISSSRNLCPFKNLSRKTKDKDMKALTMKKMIAQVEIFRRNRERDIKTFLLRYFE